MLDNQITKEELSKLLKTLEIPISEEMVRDSDVGKYPRIVYREDALEDAIGTKEDNGLFITYEITLYSKYPRDKNLIKLRNLLRKELSFTGRIYCKFNQEDKVHTSTLFLRVYDLWQE